MTTQEALNKITSVCFSHLQDLKKEEELIKDKDEGTAKILSEEQQQLYKALHNIREYMKNSMDDDK